MDTSTEAVQSVLADLHYWSDRGVRIALVEPTADGGVRVGVASQPTTAEHALQCRYTFPVTCCAYEECD
jgi:hypothetical protein